MTDEKLREDGPPSATDIACVRSSCASYWQAQRVASAAESWARLEWKPGRDEPRTDGRYLCAYGEKTMFVEYKSCVGGWLGKIPDYWLSGSLPPVPTEVTGG